MKVCRRCGEEKPLNEFHRDNGSADGRRPRCKACVKTYDDTLQAERNRRARERYAAAPQDKIKKTRQYHLDHPEWSKERLRAYHVANAAERYARQQERLRTDPAKLSAARDATRRSEQRRRAQKRAAQADFISRAQFEERLAEFGGCCYICGSELGADLHWDHYRPLAAGGTHTLSNLYPACDLCNLRKNACWPFTDVRRAQIREEVLALRKAQAATSGRR